MGLFEGNAPTCGDVVKADLKRSVNLLVRHRGHVQWWIRRNFDFKRKAVVQFDLLEEEDDGLR